MKFRRGHYSDKLEEEGRRIQKVCKEMIGVDITWTEATAIAAMRSQTTYWTDKKLKDMIAQLRGL